MEIEKLGIELFRYGEIVQDDNTLTLGGWKRTTLVRYERRLYWIQMLKGEYTEVKEI